MTKEELKEKLEEHYGGSVSAFCRDVYAEMEWETPKDLSQSNLAKTVRKHLKGDRVIVPIFAGMFYGLWFKKKEDESKSNR